MDAKSGQGHQPQTEEIPSSDPLGLKYPLLPPPVLGQSFLQPHTLSPLGAELLISLDISLMTETASGDSLHTNFSAQEPTEVIDDRSSSYSHISQAVETQFLTTAQPRDLAPKASVEMLQPQSEQVPTHREQPKASNNIGTIPSNDDHAPEVVSEQTVVESKQQPEQATQKPIAHPSSEAVATEASTSTTSPDVLPLQTKFQDLKDTNATPEALTIQESLPNPQERATHPNSEVKPSNPEPLPLANPTNSASSSTRNSGIFAQVQPSLQKAPSSNDNSLTPSTERGQVVQNKEELDLKTPPLSKKNPVISSELSQKQQVSDVQPTESLPVSIPTSRDTPTQNNGDVFTTSPEQKTSNLNNQAIESSPNPPVNLQTNNLQSSLPNLKVVASPSNTTDELSLLENSVKPSSAKKTTERPTETTTVQRAKEPSAQQVPTDKPSSPAKAATSSSAPKTNERPPEATTRQRTEKSSAQQIPTDKPHTPKVETNRTRPTDEPSSIENFPTPGSPPKNNEEPIPTTTNQRSDDLSAQTSNKVSAKKQKKQSKKSKRKKIPLKAQLSRMTERAKQDINKVGIQLKQASRSLPIGKSRTKAKGLQGSTSGSPQTQTAGVPSIQARSSPDSKQLSPEISSDLREIKTVEQVSSLEPSIEKQHQEKTEIPNQRENSQTVDAASDSEDSPIQNPLQAPVQTKSLTNSEPTINHDSITNVNKVTEPISESKAIGRPQIGSKSLEPKTDTLNQDQQKNTSSPDVTSSEESSSSLFKSKKRRQFPTQPLKRLSSISKQVLDTVSRQLEPHPNEKFIPLQKQKQTQSSKSEQIGGDQRSSAISSPRTIAEGTQPALDSSTGDSDDIAVASTHPGIQAKSSAPDTTFSSKSSSNSSEQGNQEDLADLASQPIAEERLQTSTIQAAAESKSVEPVSPHPQREDASASNTTKESSELEGHSPASLAEPESQPKSAKPRWRTIQTQVVDGITNLGSQIKEKVDRSIRKQSSNSRSPQPTQINEAGSVEPARSSEAAQTNTLLQSSDVSEPNGDNIQASAEPNSDKVNDNKQPLLTDPVLLTSTSNSVTESLVQTDAGAIVTPPQEEDIKETEELTTALSIQPSSIDEAKTSKLHQNSEQSDTALISGNEDTIQRSQDSSEIPSASSDHQTINVAAISSDTPNTAIPESSQTRDRNLPLSTNISKIGTSIVQQLANLRPKKTKSKRETKKWKPASPPATISSENTATDTTLSSTSMTEQDKTSQSADQTETSELSTVQTQASPNPENTVTVQRQHDTGESVDTDSVQGKVVSDEPASINTPASDHSSTKAEKAENIESEVLSPLTDSSVELNSATADIIQQQPITAKAANSKPSDFESSSPSSNPNLQQRTELPSSNSDTVQLSSHEDYVSQDEATQQATSTTNIDSDTDSIQRQATTNQQTSRIDGSDDPIIQTKVEHPSSNNSIQPQQQLPTTSNSSVHQFSEKEVQLSSESSQSATGEQSEVDKKDSIPDTGLQTSLAPDFEQKLDNTNDLSTQTSIQIPNSPESASSTPEKSVSLAPSNSSETSGNITETDNIVQRNIETLSESDQLLVAPTPTREHVSDASIQSEQVNALPKDPKTPALENTSAQSEPATEISNLVAKQASTVPIQAVEVSVVRPKTEPQNGDSTQLFDNSDRIQEPTPNTKDNPSIQPISESTPPQEEVDKTVKQQDTPNISSGTSASVNTSLSNDLPEAAIEPDIQASTIEQSPPSNTVPAHVPKESEFLQSNHQSKIISETKIDSNLPTSAAVNSDRTTPTSSTDPVFPNTDTPNPQKQLTPENPADSSPLVSESIQPQLDNIDSPHRRVIEIAAQRPDETIGDVNLPDQDISLSSSSAINENHLLQRNLENNSSLVEVEVDLDSGPAAAELSSNIVEKSEVAEPPGAKTDSDIQTSIADNTGSSLSSTEPLSSQPIKKPTIQRQAQVGDTLNSPPQEIEQVHTQSDSADSPVRRVIEIAAQPPESEASVESFPDLTVAQLLANGQVPSPLSSISDNLVSPKLLSSLLPSSKPNRKHHSQKTSNFQNLNIPSDPIASSEEAASFGDIDDSGMESAIAPPIQRSISNSDQALPSSWSSLENLFTAQSQSPSVVQRQPKPHPSAPEDTSDLVLTPTGIYPEKLVQRKTAPVRRTTQTLQKTSATPPQVPSPPETTEVVMRQSQPDNSAESKIDEQSFEILAREIYHVLRQRLEVERERHGGYHSGRLPW